MSSIPTAAVVFNNLMNLIRYAYFTLGSTWNGPIGGTARYFGGLHHEFMAAYDNCGGGLRFIIPITDELSARQFLVDRCEKRNKKFRADYWTKKRLTYEARDRYLNVAKKHYMPAGIECFIQPIFYEREEWVIVTSVMKEIVQLSSEAWYNDTN